MGTPDFSVTALDALVDAGHEIVAAYSQPPRPAGRGKKEQPSPVHLRAQSLGIPVFTPASLKSPEAQHQFAQHQADIAVVVAYGLLLPKAILEAPKHGCLNIHASLLPRWRGAAPIQRCIEAGDAETGVCIMQMDEGLDTGDVLLQESLPITATTTGGTLHDELSTLGAKLIVKTLADYEALTPQKQPEEGVTYAHKIKKEEALLDWSKPAVELERKIRAFNPYPATFFNYQGERIKVLAATAQNGNGEAGVTLDDKLLVACGEGALRLDVLQRQGKKAMKAEELLRGFGLAAEVVLA